MSDRADKPSEQGSFTRLAELQVVQFISDALRAGQRAILVTGRGQVSTRVPKAAVAVGVSTSARALHIRPPLPEPPELQEMIGAAVEIAGGREMTPQAMARLLLFADPRPNVILAIDEAHTLSHRSLSYLTLMTELLAQDAPILQIVLAAGPALLDTLAQPEFERLRNRLCRPGFETFQTLHGGRANGAFTGLRKPAHGRAAAGPALVQYQYLTAASPRGHGIARARGLRSRRGRCDGLPHRDRLYRFLRLHRRPDSSAHPVPQLRGRATRRRRQWRSSGLVSKCRCASPSECCPGPKR